MNARVRLLLFSLIVLNWLPGRAYPPQHANPFTASASTQAGKPADDLMAKRLAGLLPAAGEERVAVIRELAKAKDKRFIAPLTDLMRFARALLKNIPPSSRRCAR